MLEEDRPSSMKKAAEMRWLDAYHALDVTLPRATPTSAQVPQVREQLDAELHGLQTLIAAVKERRNELALPSMLPPEVMAHIFSLLADVYPIDLIPPIAIFHTGPKSASSLGWVIASHVCRRWRNICLNHPSLWARLHTDSRQPWNVFLDRSKEAPLTIEGCSYLGRTAPILEHRHHIRKLVLSDIQYSPELVGGFVGLLPRLEALSLTFTPGNSETLPSLPSGFISTTAPNLRELRLASVIFPWGEGSLNLTTLHYQHAGPSYLSSTSTIPVQHTISEVVRTLRQSPSLKTLVLLDALPNQLLEANDTIALPNIVVLDIVSNYNSCWDLWSLLRVPSTASISIYGRQTLPAAFEPTITATLRAQLRTSPLMPYRFLIVDIPEHGSLRFSLSDPRDTVSGDAIGIEKGYEPCCIGLRISCDDAAKMAKQLLAEARLEAVERLAYRGGEDFGDSQVFYDTFLSARAIAFLRLMGDGAGHGLAALRPTTVPPADDGLLFPRLTGLACTAVNFDEQINDAGTLTEVHTALGRALVERSEDFGSRLNSLDIDSCDVLGDWVDEWRELVDQVDWDGEEGDLAESNDEQSVFGYGGPYDALEGEDFHSDLDDPWGMGMF